MAGSRNNGFWIAHTLIQDLNTYNTGFPSLVTIILNALNKLILDSLKIIVNLQLLDGKAVHACSTKVIHARVFCRRLRSILSVLIECSMNNVLDNSDFGRINDGIAFIQMANDLKILLYCLC